MLTQTSLKFIKQLRNYSTMSVFVQKLNPITGVTDWLVQNEDYDYHQEVARAAFADMLHDTERNQLYELSLKAAIAKMHAQGKQAKVLDIGTGTGLLAMMAVRHGADKIYACEAFKPMGECAREIIKLNSCADKIKLIPKRSTELTVGNGCDLDERCNILVTEVFDTELIGEGALSTFTHAHKVLLEKECIVVPESATVYTQIVESPLIEKWNRCRTIAHDGTPVVHVPASVKTCPGSASVHDIQLSELPESSFKTLASPTPVFHFDWSGKSLLNFSNIKEKKLKAQDTGVAQAVFMWWELQMDQDNKYVLSCAPFWAHPLTTLNSDNKNKKIPWRDHWMQAIYYFPQELALQKDEEFSLFSTHDEYSLWFNVSKGTQNINQYKEHPICECGLHLGFSRTRLGQINDSRRQKKYLKLMEKYITKDTSVLVLGDCFVSSLGAGHFGAKKLYILETNYISSKVMKAFIDSNQSKTDVHLIKSVDELKDLSDINMILAEPYFTSGILPWDNLMFLYILRDIRKYLSKDLQVFPQKAVIKGVAVHFEDLYKIREPLGECQGFLMSTFDDLITKSSNISDDTVEAQPLWEYPGVALSQEAQIATIDLVNPPMINLEARGCFTIESDHPCNGIAIWVDWILDVPTNNTITTGPVQNVKIDEKIMWDMYTRQGVCLFSGTKKCVIDFKFSYNVNEGNVSFKCDC